MDNNKGKDICIKEDETTKTAIIKKTIIKTELLEKISRITICNIVSKYVIPAFGLIFIIVYFSIGFAINFHNDN